MLQAHTALNAGASLDYASLHLVHVNLEKDNVGVGVCEFLDVGPYHLARSTPRGGVVGHYELASRLKGKKEDRYLLQLCGCGREHGTKHGARE